MLGMLIIPTSVQAIAHGEKGEQLIAMLSGLAATTIPPVEEPPTPPRGGVLEGNGATDVSIGEYLELLARRHPEAAVRLKEWLTAIMVRDNIPPDEFWSKKVILVEAEPMMMADASGVTGTWWGRTVLWEGFRLRIESMIRAAYAGAGTWRILHDSRTSELDHRPLTRLDVATDLFRYFPWMPPFFRWQMVSSGFASASHTWWVAAARLYSGPGARYYVKGYHYVRHGTKSSPIWITKTPVMVLP
jgi:hypothetical protein